MHNHVKFPELILSSTLTSACPQGKKHPVSFFFLLNNQLIGNAHISHGGFLAVLHLYRKRPKQEAENPHTVSILNI